MGNPSFQTRDCLHILQLRVIGSKINDNNGAWNTAKNLSHEKSIFTLVTYFIYSFQYFICFLIAQIENGTDREWQ